MSSRARFLRLIAIGACVLVVNGCDTTKPAVTKPAPDSTSPRLAKAELLYEYGDYHGAMAELIELAREDANLPGLAAMRTRVARALADRKETELDDAVTISEIRAKTDINARKVLPDTYRFRRAVAGESAPLRAAGTAMDVVLEKTVSIHLEAADLETFILALGASEDVNIISDNTLSGSGSMTLHADNVPLAEILDFASRNLNVAFHVGENIIWATERGPTDSDRPLLTRVYRLRKGDPGLMLSGAENAANDQFSESHILLLDAINRFVPQIEGADVLFNKNAHVLIVKNTKANHAVIEDLIAALDVTPPQVHIEARFISIRVDSLRELGLDWLLNSPYTLSKKTILNNNVPQKADKTQIDSGAGIAFSPFVNDSQGLSLTYRGILTDPMFQAVMHALEESGKGRLLSVPRITTLNNNEARIHVGENFLYYDEYTTINVTERVLQDFSDSDVVVTTQVLVPSGQPKKEELGISLSVVPSVGADMRMITLALNPHLEEFVRYETYEIATGTGSGSGTNTTGTSIIRLPIFRESDIKTKVVVQSGETVVMGGIITTEEFRKESKVPILSDLPLIGRVFRREEVEEREQNLLIFVTATILSERGEDLVPLVGSPGPGSPGP